VPDEAARVPVLNYVNPRPAEWPQADFIVGNPPFIGDKLMKHALGEGYVESLRKVYSEIPGSTDFVMYWWEKAALLTRAGKVARFGFITTNSLRQTFNRRVVEPHLGTGKLSLLFAIPDHPWVDSADGAAVRIAMTVCGVGESSGRLVEVVEETDVHEDAAKVTLAESTGIIHPDLTIGAPVSSMVELMSNERLSINGMMLAGRGFVLSRTEAEGLGLVKEKGIQKIIKPLRNGRDLTGTPRDIFAIDAFGLTTEQLRTNYPKIYQHLLTKVKPERDANARPKLKRDWWIFGEPRKTLRAGLLGLSRYIATVETAKHRIFQFQDALTMPEHKLVVIASDDAYLLGVLSSKVHLVHALASGSTLEDRPVYPASRCFQPFPFPTATDVQQKRIRELGESIDAHRKRQQAQYPKQTLTDMYNVLEKLRASTPLDNEEQVTHEQGLVSVLRQLHDNLDVDVAAAYGLPVTATDEEILNFLCDLNAQRAAEEGNGLVRWLRPSFQHPTAIATQATLDTGDSESVAKPTKAKPAAKMPWPKTLAEQAQAVRAALVSTAGPADVATLAKTFKGAKIDRLEDILETLASLGQARVLQDGRFVAL
jgi:hypothetical protein